MNCEKCGSQIPDNSLFCLMCGAKVSVEKVLEEEVPPISVQSKSMENTSMEVENAPTEAKPATTQLTPEDAEPKKKRRFLKIAVAVGGILAFGLMVFAINNARICEADGCGEHKVDGESYCSAHFCPADYCGFAKEPDDKYCWFHMCETAECNRLKITGGKYCTDHTCKAKNCTNPRIDGGGWCSSHTCPVEGCLEPKLDNGLCFNHKIDMGEKLTNSGFSFKLNSAGGIVFNFGATNSTGKEIKYVRFKVYLFNAVDDPVKDEIKRTHTVDVEIIGPVKAGKRVSLSDKIIGYCDDCAKIGIKDITIVYTDGTQETGNFGYYYKKK